MNDTPFSTQNRTVNSESINLIAVHHSEYCYCILFLEIEPPVWERHKIGTIFGIAPAALPLRQGGCRIRLRLRQLTAAVKVATLDLISMYVVPCINLGDSPSLQKSISINRVPTPSMRRALMIKEPLYIRLILHERKQGSEGSWKSIYSKRGKRVRRMCCVVICRQEQLSSHC